MLNKATPQIIEPFKEKAKEMNLEVDGVIRFDEGIFKSCMEGGVINAREALSDVEEILKNLNVD